jgi:ribosomal protein L37AE/L43A
MERKMYNQWKIPLSQFTKGIPMYVDCDCGDLAISKYQKHCWSCPKCGKQYIQQFGEIVEKSS